MNNPLFPSFPTNPFKPRIVDPLNDPFQPKIFSPPNMQPTRPELVETALHGSLIRKNEALGLTVECDSCHRTNLVAYLHNHSSDLCLLCTERILQENSKSIFF